MGRRTKVNIKTNNEQLQTLIEEIAHTPSCMTQKLGRTDLAAYKIGLSIMIRNKELLVDINYKKQHEPENSIADNWITDFRPATYIDCKLCQQAVNDSRHWLICSMNKKPLEMVVIETLKALSEKTEHTILSPERKQEIEEQQYNHNATL
ncbi:7187_t:CDS:2 [Gigaspora margarita]|uniref:7187_t:CDS:1 n=1 Tax=Gigaspora margarita TaxID=4874 RepID=A0ABN7UP84_GIGMA|nr:7187_t:CDS:2 [Gigaspora margarita]